MLGIFCFFSLSFVHVYPTRLIVTYVYIVFISTTLISTRVPSRTKVLTSPAAKDRSKRVVVPTLRVNFLKLGFTGITLSTVKSYTFPTKEETNEPLAGNLVTFIIKGSPF